MTSTRLVRALDELYRVFSRYPRPAVSDYSPYTTITPQDVEALTRKPLRELDGRALCKFSMKALTTWGDENEFRHYLPRMLELVVVEPSWTSVPTLFGKLPTGRRSWATEEQDAIESFVHVLWEEVLRGDATCLTMAELAQAASDAEISFAPLVEIWRSISGTEPVVGSSGFQVG